MPHTVKSMLEVKGSQVWSVTPDTLVYDAIKLMSDRGIGAVLVIDGNELAGIMSERDYTRKIILQERSSRSTRVEEIMTRRVFYVDPNRTADECMALMTSKRIRHLPVLEDQRVSGVISIGDVVRAMIEDKHMLIDQLERYIVGH